MNTAKVEAGSTCVVFGAGMVGLGAVAGCRLRNVACYYTQQPLSVMASFAGRLEHR